MCVCVCVCVVYARACVRNFDGIYLRNVYHHVDGKFCIRV